MDVEAPAYDYEGKYEKTNAITEWLIAGFFGGLKDLVTTAAPSSIYEIGCGPGVSTEKLRGFVPQAALAAGELEPAMVAVARKRNPGIPIEQASVYELGLKDASVDLVCCLEVLEHLERPEDALDQIHRVTAKHAVFSVPNEPLWRAMNMARLKYLTEWGNTPGHLNHWSTGGFLRMLERRFKVIKVHTPIPWSMALVEKR
jgi:SAM-dependent methyltransferase